MVIRTVSVVASSNALTSNKGCSDKLMSYTNKGEKGWSVLLPKPTSDLVRSPRRNTWDLYQVTGIVLRMGHTIRVLYPWSPR